MITIMKMTSFFIIKLIIINLVICSQMNSWLWLSPDKKKLLFNSLLHGAIKNKLLVHICVVNIEHNIKIYLFNTTFIVGSNIAHHLHQSKAVAVAVAVAELEKIVASSLIINQAINHSNLLLLNTNWLSATNRHNYSFSHCTVRN